MSCYITEDVFLFFIFGKVWYPLFLYSVTAVMMSAILLLIVIPPLKKCELLNAYVAVMF